MKRRSLTGILLGVSGGLLLAAAGAAFLIDAGIDRRRSAMEARIRQLEERIQARRVHRSPLRGKSIAGDARPDYEEALKQFQAFGRSEMQVLHNHFTGRSLAGPEELESLFKRASSSLESLRRGTTRETFHALVRGEDGPRFLEARWELIDLACLCRYLAQWQERKGHSRESWELLLDFCRFSGDLGEVLPLDEIHLELTDLLHSGKLDRDELQEMSRELEILDRDFPRLEEQLDRSLLTLGTAVLRSRAGQTDALIRAGYREPDPSWKQLYSVRVCEMTGFAEAELSNAEARRWQELAWAEAKRHWQAFHARRPKYGESILEVYEGNREDSDLYYRGYRAQLRLLRVASHYLATGEVLDLADPFGDRLSTHRTPSGLKIVSAGDEGSEATGKAWFELGPRKGEIPTAIELEVRR